MPLDDHLAVLLSNGLMKDLVPRAQATTEQAFEGSGPDTSDSSRTTHAPSAAGEEADSSLA